MMMMMIHDDDDDELMMHQQMSHVWATSQLFRWNNFEQSASKFAHFKES